MITLPTRLDLFKRLPPGTTGAEIGVLRGDFAAEILATGVAHLYLVDPWQAQDSSIYDDICNAMDHEANYQHVLSRFTREISLGRVRIIRELSAVANALWKGPKLDWVYIDANHGFMHALSDLMNWSGLLKEDGVLMGHDYIEERTHNFGVIEAVRTFCALQGWEIEALTQDAWPSYCLRRKAA